MKQPSHQSSKPPALAKRFLLRFLRDDLAEEVQGDLDEQFYSRLASGWPLKAKLNYWYQVASYIRPFAIRKAGTIYINQYAMLQSYFTISWRNLLKNKGYSMINIGGLALGMTVAMLIGLWIYDEFSFNKNHANYPFLARVLRKEIRDGELQVDDMLTTGLGTLLKTEYPAKFERVAMVRTPIEERVIGFGDKKFTQAGYFMQPEGVEMFTLPMIDGTRDGLTDMNSIFLSESLARKLFPEGDALNKVVSMDAVFDLKVTGVYKDLPRNSTFGEATYFAPLDRLFGDKSLLNVWDNYNVDIYVQLRPGVNVAETSSIVRNAMTAHVSEDRVSRKLEIFLHPMSQWHLYNEFENGIPVTSERMKAIRYYGTIGAFVLLLACINFMNLSTARSEKRAKEVGIRKSIGSLRYQLVQQFFGESLLVTFLAFIASVFLVQLSLPWFNEVSDKNISIPWKNLVFWLSGVAFTFFTGALAGSYPAFYLSAFKPVNVLKGTFRLGRSALLPRRVLVTLQFTVSVTLTIGTMIVYQQIQFAKDRPVGYSREGLLTVRTASPEYRNKYQVLRSELKKTGVVEEIAEANYSVTDIRGWNDGFSWHDKKIEPSFNTIFVTHEYGKTVGWEFVEGRDFSRDFPTDKSGIIINESALKILGLEDPVGESLTWAPRGEMRGTFQILGVVKDMVKGSPFQPTFPSIIFLSEGDMPWLFMRMKPAIGLHEALPKMQAVFNNLVPSAAFDYTFADEAYNAKFRLEERISKLATLFSVLAIMISCLGLFGLAAFVAERRTKEIGIRKVLGASVLNLWHMLSKDFVLLVAISIVIAIPLSFSVMNKWLLQYEYRMEISWSVFVISGIGAFVVTVVTVSFQAVKAALMNPVKSLRSE